MYIAYNVEYTAILVIIYLIIVNVNLIVIIFMLSDIMLNYFILFNLI